ncbi:MAG: hypothetical protein F4X19_07045 [Acidobacteria bacterium]|nr:hypothetical protein [Acidobacteriota bacterium]
MTISAELIAICILGVSLVSLGWKVTGDLRQEIHQATVDLRQEIHLVRQNVTVLGDRVGSLDHRMDSLEHRMGGLEHRMGKLEQRMARLEGWIEGRITKQPELKAKPAPSR